MRVITLKCSILWMNIGEVAIQNGKNIFSVYQSAHFYGISPQNPVFLQ